MAQIQKTSKDANGAEKKALVKADSHKRVLWSSFSKKLLLPAAILFLLVGLVITGYNIYQIVLLASGAEGTLSLGLLITGLLLGILILASALVALLKKKKGKTAVWLGVLSLVAAIIVLTATAAGGAVVIAYCVVAIVLSIFFAIAADAYFQGGLLRFFREMFGEVKKLTWLSGRELVSYTAAVLVFVVAMSALIYLLDLAFSTGFGSLSNINLG